MTCADDSAQVIFLGGIRFGCPSQHWKICADDETVASFESPSARIPRPLRIGMPSVWFLRSKCVWCPRSLPMWCSNEFWSNLSPRFTDSVRQLEGYCSVPPPRYANCPEMARGIRAAGSPHWRNLDGRLRIQRRVGSLVTSSPFRLVGIHSV